MEPQGTGNHGDQRPCRLVGSEWGWCATGRYRHPRCRPVCTGEPLISKDLVGWRYAPSSDKPFNKNITKARWRAAATHLGHRHLEVLLRDVDPALPQGKHACLGAACLELRARRVGHAVRNLLQVDPARQVHLAGVDLEDVQAGGLVGVGELDFAVNAPRAEQGGVQDVNPVGRHQDLRVLGNWGFDLQGLRGFRVDLRGFRG